MEAWSLAPAPSPPQLPVEGCLTASPFPPRCPVPPRYILRVGAKGLQYLVYGGCSGQQHTGWIGVPPLHPVESALSGYLEQGLRLACVLRGGAQGHDLPRSCAGTGGASRLWRQPLLYRNGKSGMSSSRWHSTDVGGSGIGVPGSQVVKQDLVVRGLNGLVARLPR